MSDLPRVICEFPDVFPEKLTKLPPHRDVDFSIEVYPSTDLISIALYRMSPTEMCELNTQIEELLEVDFIRPIIFLHGVLLLYS